MKLYQCEKGKEYRIENIRLPGRMAKRLEVLGIISHTPVLIVNKKSCGTMIIKVRGARLAIGRRIAEGIEAVPSCPDISLQPKTEEKACRYGR